MIETGRFGALVALLPVLALAACGGSGGKDKETTEGSGNAARACTGGVAPAADPAAKPPADLPAPTDAVFYDIATQGATTAYFAKVAGETVTETRDGIDAQLTDAGYTITGTDQEDDAEAEAEFSGPHDGRLQVIHLCKGTLRLRFILES